MGSSDVVGGAAGFSNVYTWIYYNCHWQQQEFYGSQELVDVVERFNNSEPGPLSVSSGHEQYAVEAILADQMSRVGKEVSVKRVGYSDPSWMGRVVPVEIRATLWKAGLECFELIW